MNSFVDEISLSLISGNGGAGCVSFRREKFVEKGGPDGGDGGKGGAVLIRVSHRLRTLYHLRGKASLAAKNGAPGQGKRKQGADGEDIVVEVPPGTVIRVDDEVIFDFFEREEETFRCLEGGRGGKGNWHFRSSRIQVPRFAQEGENGRTLSVDIEMALIADVGLVGLPSAGKSTLLNHITNAHSEVAAYPFTTKIPYLGLLRLPERDIVVADIPGLISGAHQGKGLGDHFLKHISRTKAIAFILDFSDENYATALATLENELREYDPDLLKRSICLIATKMDIPEAKENFDRWSLENPQIEAIPISCFYREGLEDLKISFRKLLS